MALSDKELYEYVEKFLSFEKDGVIDLEGLEAFSKETDDVLSNEDKARMLNLANEIRQGKDDEDAKDEVEYTEYQAENQDPDQPAA